jgi:hypothetical protein
MSYKYKTHLFLSKHIVFKGTADISRDLWNQLLQRRVKEGETGKSGSNGSGYSKGSNGCNQDEENKGLMRVAGILAVKE